MAMELSLQQRRGRHGRLLTMDLSANKENICPFRDMDVSSEVGRRRSPLPVDYPRSPLQDITHVLTPQNLWREEDDICIKALKKVKKGLSVQHPRSRGITQTSVMRVVLVDESETHQGECSKSEVQIQSPDTRVVKQSELELKVREKPLIPKIMMSPAMELNVLYWPDSDSEIVTPNNNSAKVIGANAKFAEPDALSRSIELQNAWKASMKPCEDGDLLADPLLDSLNMGSIDDDEILSGPGMFGNPFDSIRKPPRPSARPETCIPYSDKKPFDLSCSGLNTQVKALKEQRICATPIMTNKSRALLCSQSSSRPKQRMPMQSVAGCATTTTTTTTTVKAKPSVLKFR